MKEFLVFLLGALLCSLAGGWAMAAQDSFGAAKSIEGEHFIIDYKEGVALDLLVDGLKVSAIDEQLANVRIDHSSMEKQLSSMAEILFNRASDILDMHVYSLKTHIKVFSDHHQLVEFFHTLYPGSTIPCAGLSFYLTDYDSIYISAASFSREILGHEMAHAIMSHYFVVQPPAKIQEVLAGYVEYQLRKSKE